MMKDMIKKHPLVALHAMGITAQAIADNIKYKGKMGISVDTLLKWFQEPTKQNKKKFKMITDGAIRLLKKEHRMK